MKKDFIILSAALLLSMTACITPGEPKEIPGPTNHVSGIRISSAENFLILRRGKDYLKIRSSNTIDVFRFFSAEAAPVICVESKDPVTEEISILLLKLPPEKIQVNRTVLQVLGTKYQIGGKSIRITGVREISANGKKLLVEYRDGTIVGKAILDIQEMSIHPVKQGNP